MKAPGALRQNDITEFISTLYDGDLHAKRVLSLANGTLGVLTSASLAVHAVGQGLAHAQGTLSKHGVKQVDRLLSNQGIELESYFARWVPYVIGARKEVVVALDWTSFARDGHETIVLSMLTRHGRATPLLWHTVEAKTLKGHQTDYEDALLHRLYAVLPEGVAVTVIADRGFAIEAEPWKSLKPGKILSAEPAETLTLRIPLTLNVKHQIVSGKPFNACPAVETILNI